MPEKISKSWFWPMLACYAGILIMSGIWFSIAVWLDAPCLWMALITVVIIDFALHLAGLREGWSRVTTLLATAVLTTVASQWLIAANAFGNILGLNPLESAQLVGKILVLEFTRLRVSQISLVWLGISVFITFWLGLRARL